MGLVLEEVDESDPNSGVRIVQMSPDSEAVLQRLDVSLGDELVSILEEDCSHWTFEDIMGTLAGIDDTDMPGGIRLGFSRPKNAVVVRFMETGLAVAAPPKTPLKPLGKLCGATSIRYSCNVGDCALCEQELVVVGSDEPSRFARMCVAKVPKPADDNEVHILPVTDERTIGRFGCDL